MEAFLPALPAPTAVGEGEAAARPPAAGVMREFGGLLPTCYGGWCFGVKVQPAKGREEGGRAGARAGPFRRNTTRAAV